MPQSRWILLAGILAIAPSAPAGELAAPSVAKFLRVLATTTGQGRVACQDAEVAAELGKLGIALDPEARIAWAVGDKDVARQVQAGRLVVCGHVAQVGMGATIALVAEGGSPSVYIRPSNAVPSRVTIPDVVLKIGKVVK
jgi:hypothetical protein